MSAVINAPPLIARFNDQCGIRNTCNYPVTPDKVIPFGKGIRRKIRQMTAILKHRFRYTGMNRWIHGLQSMPRTATVGRPLARAALWAAMSIP